jgi:hypothetical protein
LDSWTVGQLDSWTVGQLARAIKISAIKIVGSL